MQLNRLGIGPVSAKKTGSFRWHHVPFRGRGHPTLQLPLKDCPIMDAPPLPHFKKASKKLE